MEPPVAGLRAAAVVLLLGLGLWQAGAAGWIHAKALLAQVLLEHAWTRTLATGERVRPWPWADTWPVAHLRIPGLDLETIVLQGDSGRTLAFGPGLSASGAAPGGPGMTVISAHRDTHFRALRRIRTGNAIELETVAGRRTYRVTEIRILDTRTHGLFADPTHDELVLATCFPFDALVPGGPLRYIVLAEPVATM